jgi:hypothetical protein
VLDGREICVPGAHSRIGCKAGMIARKSLNRHGL